MGSQQMQQPMYQYRIILPYDDKIVNVATDMDFNVEGEAKGPIAKNTTAKSSFVVSYHCSFTFYYFLYFLRYFDLYICFLIIMEYFQYSISM
jgi:hypothetical protein